MPLESETTRRSRFLKPREELYSIPCTLVLGTKTMKVHTEYVQYAYTVGPLTLTRTFHARQSMYVLRTRFAFIHMFAATQETRSACSSLSLWRKKV